MRIFCFDYQIYKFQEQLEIKKVHQNMKLIEVDQKYLDVETENFKLVCIKSLTGTGKTQLAIGNIGHYRRILIILSRITLCYDFWKSLKDRGYDFLSYE